MAQNPARVVLLGGGGFIGANLAHGLAKTGLYDVTVVDIDRAKLDLLPPGPEIRFVQCDIRDDEDIPQSLIRESNITVDLIAYANPAIYLSHPIEVVDLNFFGNLKIVEWCAKYRKRLIQFSTCEVYGKTGGKEEPFKEDATDCILGPVCNHRWIYSCAKQLLERIIHSRGLKGELDYTIIRPFNFIGPLIDYLVEKPGDGNPRVFSHFMSALLYGHPMCLVDGGHARRSYTYIDDAVDAMLAILANPEETHNQIINIGNPGNEVSIRDFAQMMRDLYGQLTGNPCQCTLVETSAEDFYGSGYEDCDRRIPEVSKLKRLGWSPKYDLLQTLRMTMEFHLKHHHKLTDKTMAYRILPLASQIS